MEKAKVRDLSGKLVKGDSFYIKVDVAEMQDNDGRVYMKTAENNGDCVNGWLFGGDTYELNDILVDKEILNRKPTRIICIDDVKYKLVPMN